MKFTRKQFLIIFSLIFSVSLIVLFFDLKYRNINPNINSFELQVLREKNKLVYNELQEIKSSTPCNCSGKSNDNQLKVEEKSLSRSVGKSEPTLEYEMSLRRIGRNIDDLWLYLRDKLNSSQMKFFNELRYSLLTDIKIITDRDRRSRKRRLKTFNEMIFDKIKRIQNPGNCKSAMKLVCDPIVSTGFGGIAAHWTICLQ